MGSSAAITSAIIKAVYKQLGKKIDKKRLFEMTKEIEDFQHGKSSGVDPAIVINGGFLSYNHNIDGSKSFEQFNMNKDILKNIFLLNTGVPIESTGEMVAGVRKRYLKSEKKYKAYFKKINEIVSEVKKGFGNIYSLINENGIILEKMCVVSDQGLLISKEIRKNGGAIKIAGAGGTKGQACGIMLCKHQDLEFVKKVASKYNCEIISPRFGVDGIN
jgi:mevalonate kinase